MRRLPVIQSSPLPPLYAAWMDELLAGPIPQETDATCEDCAMVTNDGVKITNGISFNPETKCCTYIPVLPNFLVGRILGDNDTNSAAGRATVEERLKAGIAVTPLGLGQPPDFQALYGQSSESLFGRSATLRCPHYLTDGGRCGIWQHRASICATWYCKFVRGAVGRRFWQTLNNLLSAVELCLSRWCVLELNIGNEALRHIIQNPGRQSQKIDPLALDGAVDKALQRKLWGRWAERERDFYRECATLVAQLSWRDVLTIGGPDLKILAQLVLEAYATLKSKRIPERLRMGPLQIIRMNNERSWIVTHSSLDPLDLPSRLLDVLCYFDGRPTEDAVKAIAAEHGVKLDSSLIRKLSDFEVLVSSNE
jgi:hypothetical protein